MSDHIDIALDQLTLASETSNSEVERMALLHSLAESAVAIAEALERGASRIEGA